MKNEKDASIPVAVFNDSCGTEERATMFASLLPAARERIFHWRSFQVSNSAEYVTTQGSREGKGAEEEEEETTKKVPGMENVKSLTTQKHR